MAGCVNKVIIIGNLGADPEVRQTQIGQICSLRVATTDTWRDKQSGERREKVEWHSITIYNEPLVKVAKQFLKKGSKVYIEGSLETRKWQDKEGNDRYTTEVVLRPYRGELTMLDGKPQNGAQADAASYARAQPIENMRNAPQRAQISGQPPAKKSFPGRQSHDFELDDSVPWLDE